jgi:hypothetical protein
MTENSLTACCGLYEEIYSYITVLDRRLEVSKNIPKVEAKGEIIP